MFPTLLCNIYNTFHKKHADLHWDESKCQESCTVCVCFLSPPVWLSHFRTLNAVILAPTYNNRRINTLQSTLSHFDLTKQSLDSLFHVLQVLWLPFMLFCLMAGYSKDTMHVFDLLCTRFLLILTFN